MDIDSLNWSQLDHLERTLFKNGRNIYQLSLDEFCSILIPIQQRREFIKQQAGEELSTAQYSKPPSTAIKDLAYVSLPSYVGQRLLASDSNKLINYIPDRYLTPGNPDISVAQFSYFFQGGVIVLAFKIYNLTKVTIRDITVTTEHNGTRNVFCKMDVLYQTGIEWTSVRLTTSSTTNTDPQRFRTRIAYTINNRMVYHNMDPVVLSV